MSNTIYLYLKTHNKTGLQYFGMTKQDPCKYMGSGKRWRTHLSKHGNDVTTEIIFESDNKVEIADVGKHYSKLWNIVESDKFANLKIEEGDGGFDHINENPELTEKRLKRLRECDKTLLKNNRFTEYAYRRGAKISANKSRGKERDSNIKDKISNTMKGKTKGCRWYNDGNRNIKIREGDLVPDGFIRGMVFRAKNSV